MSAHDLAKFKARMAAVTAEIDDIRVCVRSLLAVSHDAYVWSATVRLPDDLAQAPAVYRILIGIAEETEVWVYRNIFDWRQRLEAYADIMSKLVDAYRRTIN